MKKLIRTGVFCMTKRNRVCKSFKDELIKKSRESMLGAVQIYNNPQITFKTETFITLAIISWTYLLHAYYRGANIDYRYFEVENDRKKYNKTKNGAIKHWELERCLNDNRCPLDNETKCNLRFLIGLRHEIEHQMTNRIDEYLSAKIHACCLNYNRYIKQIFGDKYGVDNELALSIQFSPITPEQSEILLNNSTLSKNLQNYIASFESDLHEQILSHPYYAYRLLYVPINANRKGQADRVIEFVKPESPLAAGINKEYHLIKETEKQKYYPKQVVEIAQTKGYTRFSMHHHTQLWKKLEIDRMKTHYGTYVAGKTWVWYQSWIDRVLDYCEQNSEKFK